ncbi:hypothetical protein GRI89_06730 [Altererythrobacter salegens]|uniref:Uncharacterized protein n=1 Tax=Croceibacterium salegens TaxID=1737568 RepID=A0A6I4SY35_9SPHN|nr:hypothetical protein [Croceibacterium salegens]MXO59232.1 hypothetical protein [Croceibacterium salegens]
MPDFAVAAEEVRGGEDAQRLAGLPPSREEYVTYSRGEAMELCDDRDELDAEMEAAGAEAGAAYDDWRARGDAVLDAVLDGEGGETPGAGAGRWRPGR